MQDQTVFNLLCAVAVACVGLYLHWRKRGGGTEFGSASWASDKLLRTWGMLGKQARGLILARSIKGDLIRIPRYTHTLLVGGSGSGKGIGIVIPNLLDYFRGSLVAFDCKGDLYATTARWRQLRGSRVIRLAPFNGGADRFNPLDTIEDNPFLIDHAKALAEALIVRQGTESEPHWNDRAAQILSAIIVYVLLCARRDERNLSSVADIASDPELLTKVAEKLWMMDGIPGRMGSTIRSLFESGSAALTKEGSGCLSTLLRHLNWISSPLAEPAIADSTFDPLGLLKPGTTLFIQIPPDMLDSMRGLLRCWISTLVRIIGSHGSEMTSEVLFLLDEASALGSLAAIEEALVRGRSAGVRMLLMYQSSSQVETAFKDKPTLLYDNCDAQIFLSGSHETCDRISKMLGSYTQQVNSFGENSGASRPTDGNGGGSRSYGSSTNIAPQARPLLYPDEVRRSLGGEYLIAFLNDLPAPIFARKIKWFADQAFNPNAPPSGEFRWIRGWKDVAMLTFIAVGIIAIIIGGIINHYGR